MELEEAYRIIQGSSPKLKFCEWFDEDSNMWEFKRHSHPYIELIYYVEGKGDVDVAGTNVKFSLYDTVVYPAYQEHQDKRTPERRREIICLWIDIPELVFEAPVRLKEQEQTLYHEFATIFYESKREKPNAFLLEYAMKILLLEIVRAQHEAVQEDRIPDRAIEYIRNNYAKKITLEELADLEHISQSYLSRKFRQRTGLSVIAYINQLRVERAKQYLMASALDVGEIAYQVGFESPKYFHRVFREQVGESPATFRKKFKIPG